MRKGRKTARSDSSSKPKKLTDEDSWRAPLEEISINDDDWRCIVIMMVETITEHSRCVSLFNAAAAEGKRKSIYSLSCQKTLDSLKALSKHSLDKCPTIQGVCHYASKVFNADNGMLPDWLMALAVKFLIYRAREESIGIVKRLADLEHEIEEEYWIMQTVADWGQPGAKNFDMEKFNNKANTKLRKRDEEWRDTVYVDDAPINGPNLYIILSGFHNPDLPQHLINVGVPLHCIMKIKRPNERLDRLVRYETIEGGSGKTKKLQFVRDYTVGKIDLFNFWTKIEERLNRPETYPEYCDVGFLTFCPPQFPEAVTDDEYEIQKKDMYDRVSCIVYDFYDLYRQHDKYLTSMRMEDGIISRTTEKLNTEVYESLLDAFPMECVSVPIILYAILTQVEANEKTITPENSMVETGDPKAAEEKNTGTTAATEIDDQTLAADTKSHMTGAMPSTIDETAAVIEEKIKILNIKYGLDDTKYIIDDNGHNQTDIDLTLHGDTLLEAIRLLDNAAIVGVSNANDLLDNILPIFRFPGIANLCNGNKISEKRLNDYARHLDNIRDYFDVNISDEEVRHYLHILMFDRMIFGSSKPKIEPLSDATIEEVMDLMYRQRLSSTMKRSRSLPSMSAKSRPEGCTLSDGNIDYGKIVPEIIECSSLFDLIDPRELLMPGYLNANIFQARPTGSACLDGFSDIELLSKPIFLQLLHECFLRFNHVDLRYFEPTDSLLLHFGNKWKVNNVRKEERVSSIRTPVRLRDFCKYVVPEETDWLRREEELYRLQTAGSMERLMKKSMEIYDETMLFRDEDFILPGTLKARDLERSNELARQRSTSEMTSVKETMKDTKKGAKKTVSEKGKKKGKKSNNNRASSKKLSIDQESTLNTQNALAILSPDTEPIYDFVGYDLGRLRVQVTNRKRTFYSADGTLVQLEIDDWLYQTKDIRIAITLHGYSLRLSHRIGSPETNNVFHLTSKTGIILAFQKLLASRGKGESGIPFQHSWQHMNVQFRASWPTGLHIEPIIGDGPQNPYYIQQSYIPKRNNNIVEEYEICRKFLRNGTVLKYLSNNNVIVLRPNGVIVTCTAFTERKIKQHESDHSEGNILRTAKVGLSGDRLNRGSKLPSKGKTKPTGHLFQLDGSREGGPALLEQNPTTDHGDVLSTANYTTTVSRYTVLDHDGSRYEVVDDLIVSEQHRLLVRMASDYEVDEKFTRRADDTNMLLNSNGELIVRYPDGTRITTGYTIENEPVMCDWTEEDIVRYFTSDGIREEEESYEDASFFNLRYDGGASSRRNAEHEEKIAELLITDSFVSVLLTCRIEHKNYATVSYDQLEVSCTLSMPDDLRVSISRGGDYEVSMEGGVNLKINEDTLSFKGNACTSCSDQSASIYYFLPLEISSVIFTTTDVFGNTYQLKNDGTTRYYSRSQETPERKTTSHLDAVELNNQGEHCNENHDEEDVPNRCRHERLSFKDNVLDYRIFSVNRNLTAYEYIHRFTRNQAEMMATFNNKTSVFFYPSLRRPKLQHLVTYEPVEAVSRSKCILSFPDHQVRPTNFDRTDILRSTYSIPYDWLFPFGKKGDGIWKNTHDLPLMTNVETLPELLRIRILRSFKESGGNAVIDLQRALGRYWMSIVRGIYQPPGATNDGNEIVKKRRKSIYDHLEDKLCSLALGIEKSIDGETYRIGLERPRNVGKVKATGRSRKVDEFLGHTAEKEEQLQWYKRCMREKFILPYFQNITGACFLWVMDCMKNALNISTARLLCGERSSFSISACEGELVRI